MHDQIDRYSRSRSDAGLPVIFADEDFGEVGGNPAGWAITNRDSAPMKEPKRLVLAHGKVRHVGGAYAAVIAETVEQARDVAVAIVAEIE